MANQSKMNYINNGKMVSYKEKMYICKKMSDPEYRKNLNEFIACRDFGRTLDSVKKIYNNSKSMYDAIVRLENKLILKEKNDTIARDKAQQKYEEKCLGWQEKCSVLEKKCSGLEEKCSGLEEKIRHAKESLD